MSHFYKNLEPVESQQQKIVRVFNEQKAVRIKRMQAMKKGARQCKVKSVRQDMDDRIILLSVYFFV